MDYFVAVSSTCVNRSSYLVSQKNKATRLVLAIGDVSFNKVEINVDAKSCTK